MTGNFYVLLKPKFLMIHLKPNVSAHGNTSEYAKN